MGRYNLCLFDLDGTLVDPYEGIIGSAIYAMEQLGIKVPEKAELDKFIGPPIRDSMRALGFPDVELAVSKYREHYTKVGITGNKIYPGVFILLESLKSQGITTAIATSKATVYAEQIAGHFGFGKYFDLIVGSELDGARSRKFEIISHILDSLDPKRGKTPLMIGDREFDIIGANEVGIDSIGVIWGYGPRAELEKAGATRIVDSPEELLKVIQG